MKRKQIFSILLLAGMLLSMMALGIACTTKEESVTVHLKISNPETSDVLCDKDVVVTGKDLSVKDALSQACDDVALTLVFSDDGKKPVQIGDYVDQQDAAIANEEEPAETVEGEEPAETEAPAEETTDEALLYYWEYTLNGVEATVGADAQKIVEGDNIEWIWTKLVPTEE